VIVNILSVLEESVPNPTISCQSIKHEDYFKSLPNIFTSDISKEIQSFFKCKRLIKLAQEF